MQFHITNNLKPCSQYKHLSAIIFKNVSNTEIRNFLETFISHQGKSLKVHFNLFLRIQASVSEKKIQEFFLIKGKIRGNLQKL